MADVPEVILKEFFNQFSWEMPQGTSYDNFARLVRGNSNEFLAADMVDELYDRAYSDMDRDTFEANIGEPWKEWQNVHAGFWVNTMRGAEERAYMLSLIHI